MTKLFGAILIMLCGMMIGCTPLLKLMERKQELYDMISALEQMKAELNTDAPSVLQIMKRVGERHCVFRDIASEMEKSGPIVFYDAWHSCVDRAVLLHHEERRALHELGEVLGRYVLEEQVEAIERTVPILRDGADAAKEQLRSVSKLYIGTALSLSAMLVIVLL